MKMFVLESVGRLTNNYHSAGALVIVAPDEASARALFVAEAEKAAMVTDEEWAKAIVYDIAGDVTPRIFIFANAGCC